MATSKERQIKRDQNLEDAIKKIDRILAILENVEGEESRSTSVLKPKEKEEGE